MPMQSYITFHGHDEVPPGRVYTYRVATVTAVYMRFPDFYCNSEVIQLFQ